MSQTLKRLLQLVGPQKGRLIASCALSVVGTAMGLVPFILAHFIAELDGKLVGICDGYWKEEKEPWLASTGRSPWAYLRNAFVAPELHGQGIGRVVCLAFYEWLRAGCHAPYLYLDYFTVNPAGARYWPTQGFRPVVYRLQRVIP